MCHLQMFMSLSLSLRWKYIIILYDYDSLLMYCLYFIDVSFDSECFDQLSNVIAPGASAGLRHLQLQGVRSCWILLNQYMSMPYGAPYVHAMSLIGPSFCFVPLAASSRIGCPQFPLHAPAPWRDWSGCPRVTTDHDDITIKSRVHSSSCVQTRQDGGHIWIHLDWTLHFALRCFMVDIPSAWGEWWLPRRKGALVQPGCCPWTCSIWVLRLLYLCCKVLFEFISQRFGSWILLLVFETLMARTVFGACAN